MGAVPAASQALAVLGHLGRQGGPVPAASIARELGLPRSTTYHLLDTLIDAGFVVHLPDEHRYGLGLAAYELGTGYLRQAPLQRLARVPLAGLVDRTRHAAHLAVLHGREVVYLLEERAPGRTPLVTDVGVRLPAPLTASGRALLGALPPAQLRALFPDADSFVRRHDSGPASLAALQRLLADDRRRGYAEEHGEITPGFASVACTVSDHGGHPVAAVALTYPVDEVDAVGVELLAGQVRYTARTVTRRLGGGRQM